MNLKLLSEALSSIYNLRHNAATKKKFPKVSSHLEDNLKGEERQGVSNVITEIYEIEKDTSYIKLLLETDSYGYGETVTGIEFVKPVEKLVTQFEKI